MKQAISTFHTSQSDAAIQLALLGKTGAAEGFGQIIFKKGRQAHLALGAEKYCTGFESENGWQPCPSFAAITAGQKCKACERKDAPLECARCNGSICLSSSKEMRDWCQSAPHALYLASFAGVAKVGISASTRVEKRWIEQGADFACKALVFPNGRAARFAESKIAKELQLRLFLRNSEKIKLLQFNEGECRESLEKQVQKARLLFPQNTSDAEIQEMSKLCPGYPEKSELEQVAKAQSASGAVLGCKGKLLFLKQGGQIACYELSGAIGRIVQENALASFI